MNVFPRSKVAITYYGAFAAAIAGNGRPPVTAEEAIAVLAVLDAARTSAVEGRTVHV